MTVDQEKLLDDVGWQILAALQDNGRLSFAELGRRVHLSLPAVAERVKRMEEAGIIAGYHAEVDTARLGLPVVAIVRLGSIGGQSCQRAVAQVSAIPEVLECYRVTGDDSVVVKVVATSVDHLARIIDQLSLHGIPATSIVRSNPMKRYTITREMCERGEG